MIVLAHPSHWIESVLVLVPTVGFVLWLAVLTIRARLRGEHEDDADPSG